MDGMRERKRTFSLFPRYEPVAQVDDQPRWLGQTVRAIYGKLDESSLVMRSHLGFQLTQRDDSQSTFGTSPLGCRMLIRQERADYRQ